MRLTDLRRLTSGWMTTNFIITNKILTSVVIIAWIKPSQDSPRGNQGPSFVGVEPSVQSAPGRKNHPGTRGDHFVLEIWNITMSAAGVGKHGDCVWVCGRLQPESSQLRLDWVPPCLQTGASQDRLSIGRYWYEDGMMQVATFSVYAYFTAALFGRQFLEPRGVHKSVLGRTPMIFNTLHVNTLSKGLNSPRYYLYSREDWKLDTILFDNPNPKSSNSMFNLLKLLSSDNTTFPAIPNMNFAADGPFANHTPGDPASPECQKHPNELRK